MILIDISIDGGAEKYQRALDIQASEMKKIRNLFNFFMDYFEGKSVQAQGKAKKPIVLKYTSPIKRIYESEGQLIGGKWGVSSKYAVWKAKNWQKMREYDVGISSNNKQILTGRTLYSLLSRNGDSIRESSNSQMVYGTKVDYAYENQMKRKIIDFFPEMVREMDRITAVWVAGLSRDLEVEA